MRHLDLAKSLAVAILSGLLVTLLGTSESFGAFVLITVGFFRVEQIERWLPQRYGNPAVSDAQRSAVPSSALRFWPTRLARELLMAIAVLQQAGGRPAWWFRSLDWALVLAYALAVFVSDVFYDKIRLKTSRDTV